MTDQKKFKREVRARMERTGETYSAARRHLDDEAAVRESQPVAGPPGTAGTATRARVQRFASFASAVEWHGGDGGDSFREGLVRVLVDDRRVYRCFGPHADARRTGCAPPSSWDLLWLGVDAYDGDDPLLDPDDGERGICSRCQTPLCWAGDTVKRDLPPGAFIEDGLVAFPADWDDASVRGWFDARADRAAADADERMRNDDWHPTATGEPDLADDEE